jgi:hypothetical protein
MVWLASLRSQLCRKVPLVARADLFGVIALRELAQYGLDPSAHLH